MIIVSMTTFDYFFEPDARLPFLVYGSLRSGQGNSRLLHGAIERMEVVRVHGVEMYSNKAFPFALPTGKDEDVIVAELVDVFDDQYENVMVALDALEGYHGLGDDSNLYDRAVVSVTTTTGEVRKAFMYVTNRDTARLFLPSLPKVASGDWLNYDER